MSVTAAAADLGRRVRQPRDRHGVGSSNTASSASSGVAPLRIRPLRAPGRWWEWSCRSPCPPTRVGRRGSPTSSASTPTLIPAQRHVSVAASGVAADLACTRSIGGPTRPARRGGAGPGLHCSGEPRRPADPGSRPRCPLRRAAGAVRAAAATARGRARGPGRRRRGRGRATEVTASSRLLVDGVRPNRRAISRTPRPRPRRVAMRCRCSSQRYRPQRAVPPAARRQLRRCPLAIGSRSCHRCPACTRPRFSRWNCSSVRYSDSRSRCRSRPRRPTSTPSPTGSEATIRETGPSRGDQLSGVEDIGDDPSNDLRREGTK